ncbi:MAG TPA: AMP-binding protein, partial [Acidobacteriaceae bacterium]
MRPHLASLVEDFRAHAAETAVVAHRGNRRYPTTYGELASLAGRFSAELERRGIGPGDRVVIWGENSAEWIAVFFGCLLRGVIAVPLDAAGDARFAARVVQETAPKLIVGDSGLLASLDRADAARERVPQGLKPTHDTAAYGTAEAVPLSETGSSAIPRTAMHSVGEHLPAAALFAVDPSVNEQAPFQIVFTSGTTSEPRGIVHTHRNVLVSLAPIEREMAKYRRYERIFHPLRFLHSLPLSHVFGQFMGLWIPALLAAEVHFAAELEPSRIAALIRRERISVLIAVPRVLHLLRAHLLAQFPESSQLSVVSSQKERDGAAQDLGAGTKTTTEILRVAQNDGSGGGTREITRGMVGIVKRWWRFRRVHRALGWKFWAVISGGATLPAELETFWRRLGFALIQGYGMTETAALVTLNHPFHVKQGSIGRPLPGREVKISDDGEILVRGDMLSGATWSGGAMHPREGEWLATGDLAEKNASGELRFLGRKGDVIVTGAGLNIHPGDLESALSAQAGIRSCVVVGCEFASGTEPVAVVLTAGPDANLQAAVDAANRTLAGYQQIRRVLRWPELQFPYTSTGKLIRRQVAAWACATLASRHSGAGAKGQDKYGDSGLSGQNDDGRRDSLLSLIAEVTGEPIPATDGPNRLRLSEDLHLDSLGRVQLQSALEQRFSLELEDDAIAVIQTVGDLRALIDQHLAPTTPVPTTSPSEQRSVSGELQFTESAVSGQRSAISQQQPA